VRIGLATTAILTVLAGGVGTLLISREVAIHQTQAFLVRSATALSLLIGRADLHLVRAFLASSGVGRFKLIAITVDGKVARPLPRPLVPSLVSPSALSSGHYQTGVYHNVAYVLYPVGYFHARVVRTLVLAITRPLPSIEGPIVFVLTATLLTAVLAVTISDRYTAHISRSLARLVDRAHQVAAGVLDSSPTDPTPKEEELAELDEAVSSMVASLKAASELESTFLLSVSHDLRTPLTSIRGFSEAIIDGAVSPSEAARTIGREAERIERLLNDLIALAHLRSHDWALAPQRVDLVALVTHLADTVRPRATLAGIDLHVDLPSAPLEASLDPERTLQLLGNILQNALKYAASRVTIDLTSDGDGFVLAISDDGPGIPPPVRERIFSSQLTPSPGRDGTIGSGLGLLIVGRLASLMGYAVTVTSPTSGGTRFEIIIPQQPPAVATTLAPRAAPRDPRADL
jgi:signal transduction histidine kinase